jgi:putative lipoic acid-binding regulatory protein
MDSNRRKPEIEYPTKWGYRVIGTDVEKLLEAIREVIPTLEYEVRPSNVSKNNKYFSLNLIVSVPSEVVRDLIFQKLDSHPDVKIVI